MKIKQISLVVLLLAGFQIAQSGSYSGGTHPGYGSGGGSYSGTIGDPLAEFRKKKADLEQDIRDTENKIDQNKRDFIYPYEDHLQKLRNQLADIDAQIAARQTTIISPRESGTHGGYGSGGGSYN